MAEGTCPVRWAGRQAVVTLPARLDVANADQVSERLLSVINGGAAELIADMTATASCDHAGADAVVRAYQRAAASGTQLRLAVTAQAVRRVLSLNGLDRVIPVYPSLQAATAAAGPAAVIPLVPMPTGPADDGPAAPHGATPARSPRRATRSPDRPRTAAITQAVLGTFIRALADAVALADDDGTLALVNRRLEDMFGYEHGELTGHPVESLIPAGLRAAHRGHRAAYARAPRARPMAEGARLVGLRKDSATFPIEVSLSPVPTATGHLTLAVIRDVTEARQRADLADLARAAAAAEQAQRSQQLLAGVVTSLLNVGLSLQAATGLPSDLAQVHISQALQHLDDAIHEIRDHVFAAGD